MNNQVRTILINQAIKGTPIVYGDIMKYLKWDHNNPRDRDKLSSLLYEISKFEHENGRPLLSSMAMYSGLTDHGSGFYELTEQFGYGKRKDLREKEFAFEQMNQCITFWKDESNYIQYGNLESSTKSNRIEFFKQDEIDFLHNWSGRTYDKESEEHQAAKNYIMNSLGTKTVYWSNELVKMLPDMEAFNWRMWSQKGWEDTPNGKVRIARFKSYTWARIFRKGDEYKDIFFTVGVDGISRELIYKLDYYFQANSELNSKQKEIIEQNIPSELRWKSVPIEDFHGLNWMELLSLTSSFISENLPVYDRLIAMVWGEAEPLELNNSLRKQPKPHTGLSELPVINPSFAGIDKDFIQESIDKKELGDAGEELVLQYERKFLIDNKLDELALKVKKVKDGKGYDILSFNLDSTPKYIEVKTTTGNMSVPFVYTIYEYIFSQKNIGQYQIYRLYNYDDETNSADFYIIENPTNELLFQPLSYKAYTKDVI